MPIFFCIGIPNKKKFFFFDCVRKQRQDEGNLFPRNKMLRLRKINESREDQAGPGMKMFLRIKGRSIHCRSG